MVGSALFDVRRNTTLTGEPQTAGLQLEQSSKLATTPQGGEVPRCRGNKTYSMAYNCDPSM